MRYDIIGDIHGQSAKLRQLLQLLGYRDDSLSWRHPDRYRQAIFVGDFVDRGPGQLETVDIVRRMVEEGAALAVMGNHELNAAAWHTPHPRRNGEYLRPRSGKWGSKNRSQHEAFLREVGEDSKRHQDIIDWFLTLPLWIELPGIKVVHACWHTPFMQYLEPRLHARRWLTRELLAEATDEPENEAEKDNAIPSLFKAVEALTKGLEIPLPGQHSFNDKDGHSRTRVRVRWWDSNATTYRKAALMEGARETLPEVEIPKHAQLPPVAGKPVFFGHYWMTGVPRVLSRVVACVDYSAGKGGPLVAYQWRGETVLNQMNFASAA